MRPSPFAESKQPPKSSTVLRVDWKTGNSYCWDVAPSSPDSSEESQNPSEYSTAVRILRVEATHVVVALAWQAPSIVTVTGDQTLRRLEGKPDEEVLITDVGAQDKIYIDSYGIQPNTTYEYCCGGGHTVRGRAALGWIQVRTLPLP